MKKFLEITSICKASVTIEYNRHKDVYESVQQHMDDAESLAGSEIVNRDVLAKMIESDTIFCMTFHPHTPVSFYVIYHHDLDLLLDEALKILRDL